MGRKGEGRTAQTLNWAQGPRCEPHRVQVPRACPSSSHPAALPSRAPPAPSAFTDRGSRDPASLKLYGPSSVFTAGGEEGVSGTERSQCRGSRGLLKRWPYPSAHRHWVADRALHMGAWDPVSPGGSCRPARGLHLPPSLHGLPRRAAVRTKPRMKGFGEFQVSINRILSCRSQRC